jgi:trehalose utilization protein
MYTFIKEENMVNITVWNEYRHEKNDENIKKVYPDGIHKVIANFLTEDRDFNVSTATLDEPEHGLTDDILNKTDVLIWWGHMAHHEVSDVVVDKVYNRVLEGMGLIVLHSGHGSKIFRKLCGTNSGRLKWRDVGEKERIWVIEPGHPIANGLNEYIEIPQEEMYGERFDIPKPDDLVFISWFEGGEVFRSGCCYNRGKGKIFYFRPGHEAFPVYYRLEIQKVVKNAVKWATPNISPKIKFGYQYPLEELKNE